MRKPSILVTAAAGNTGFPVVMQLREKGYPVRAFVHRQSERSRLMKSAGADVFVGNMHDIRDVREALKGMQRAYYCAPFAANHLHTNMIFAVAANEAKLEVVTKMTQWFSDVLHPSAYTREHALTDEIMPWMPHVDVITINPAIFASFYMLALPPIAQFGMMAMPDGGVNAPVSNEDMARVVVGTLINPSPHIGKCYRPTGPDLLSQPQIAEVFSKVLARKVSYSEVPIKMFIKSAKVQGFSLFEIDSVRYYFEELKRGTAAVNAPNDVVREIGGCEPESFEVITRRYVEHNPETVQSLGNKLKVAGFLLKMFLTSAPDMEDYAVQQNQPLIKNPCYAADSQAWMATHNHQDIAVCHEGVAYEPKAVLATGT